MSRARLFGFVIDPASCLHCGGCVIACKAENAVPPGRSRNRLIEHESGIFPDLRVSVEPWQCMQCDDAPCVRVCPTGASYHGANGVVLVSADDCIGCRYCIEACPYDARYLDEASGTVDKCTFCEHRVARGLEPACVATCPARTRVFGDLNDPASEVARLVAAGTVEIRRARAKTDPKVFYLREA